MLADLISDRVQEIPPLDWPQDLYRRQLQSRAIAENRVYPSRPADGRITPDYIAENRPLGYQQIGSAVEFLVQIVRFLVQAESRR